MIRITAKKNGFRRCGVAHSDNPTDYPDDHFSEEELALLKAEQMLLVEVVAENEKAAAKKQAKDK